MIFSVKRCLEYTTQGVWVGNTHDTVQLPTSITSLFDNWQSSTQQTFKVFNKFVDPIARICVHESVENQMTHFLYKSSPKTCRERISDVSSGRIHKFIKKINKTHHHQKETERNPPTEHVQITPGNEQNGHCAPPKTR